MALTDLEFCHIRMVGKAWRIVDRRRLSPEATSLSTPAFFELMFSQRARLITAPEKDAIFDRVHLCSYSNEDESVQQINHCLLTRLSVYALYPDKGFRKQLGIKRGFGVASSVPIDGALLQMFLSISIMACEYASIMRTIARSSAWFEVPHNEI